MSGFEGDVLLVATDDGADIVVSDGLVEPCASAQTAALVSLFGGNGGARAGGNDGWWGNCAGAGSAAERVESAFLSEISGGAVSGAMIPRARKAAEDDLKWMVDEGIADSVSVNICAVGRNELKVTIDARKDGGTAFLAEFKARTGGM